MFIVEIKKESSEAVMASDFKTMLSKIKVSQKGIDVELLKLMGFDIISYDSISKDEIHFKNFMGGVKHE